MEQAGPAIPSTRGGGSSPSVAMPYELGRFALRRYPQITDRKQREAEAERHLIRLFFSNAATGRYVEVGANDPKVFSQTWHLEQLGWTGVLVEPIPELCDRLRAARPDSTVVQAACGRPEDRGTGSFAVAADQAQSALQRDRLDFRTDIQRVENVSVVTLDDILDKHAGPPLDFVSIDVEGMQLDVLRGFSLVRHRPRLLLIEDHLTDLATHRHIQNQGYRLVKRTGLNNWYVPRQTLFTLTSSREKLKLWKKIHLSTPFRRLRFALRRGLKR